MQNTMTSEAVRLILYHITKISMGFTIHQLTEAFN